MANHADRLAGIRARIIESRRRKLYQDIVVALFESHGDLSPENIQARFDEAWVEPSGAVLDSLVAGKVRSAVAHSAAQLQLVREGDQRSKDKVARVRAWTEELMERLAADAADTASVEAAEAELDECRALAELVGDTHSAPPGPSHVASAPTASATRKAK